MTLDKKILPGSKTLNITCKAKGNPASYTFSAFVHLRQGRKIRELNGSNELPDEYVLTIHPYSYNDIGTYQCTVSNGITDTNSTGNITIDFQSKDRINFTCKIMLVVMVVLVLVVVVEE